MSLDTGKPIHAYHWEYALTIPDSVTEISEELSSGEKIPLLQNGGPIFEWAPGVPIDDKDVTDE